MLLKNTMSESGEKGKALEVLRPARDPRYGLTNSQPAIQRLLEELGG